MACFVEKEEIDEREEPPLVSVWDLTQARELAGWACEQRDDQRQWNQTFWGRTRGGYRVPNDRIS